MPAKLMQKLAQKNHTLQKESGQLGMFDHYSFVTGLTFIDGLIETNCDYRSQVCGSDGELPNNLTQYCHPLEHPCASAPFP
ncbi:hypothetical protein MTO96_049522 [Rhipicephalus appendiculatus]